MGGVESFTVSVRAIRDRVCVCVCVCVRVRARAQSCPALCDAMDRSSLGFSVHGILQARTVEWVAIPFSRRSSRPRDRTRIFCIGRQILYHCTTQRGP